MLNAKLADTLTTVADGRAAAIILGDLVQLNSRWTTDCQTIFFRIYKFRPN